MDQEETFIKSRLIFVLFIAAVIFFAELSDILLLPALNRILELDEELMDIFMAVFISVPFIWWLIKYRDRSEDKIRENEKRFSSVIQTANEGIILADSHGNIVSWNNSATVIFGYEPDEILGKNLSILMPEHYNSAHSKIGESNISGESKVIGKTIETYGLRKNGSEFPIEISVSTWKTRKGTFFTGIIRDITERKKEQEQIELLKHSIDLHYDGAYWIDTDNRFIYVNNAGCKALGYKHEELIGKSVIEINRNATPEKLNLVWEKLRKDGFFSTESVHCRRDGSEFPVELVSTYIQFGGKEYNCGFARDITERKHAEEVLKKSLSILEKALAIGKMGSWEWDMSTNELTWSEEVFKLYGLDPAKDRPNYEVVVNTLTPECRNEFLKNRDDALKDGKPFDNEYCLTRPDGTRRYAHTKGEVIRDRKGTPARMSGIVQDITEHKQAEEKLLLFRNLIERSNDAIFVNEAQTGLILDANDRASRNMGFNRDELLKMHVYDFEVTLPDKFSWKEHVKDVRSKGHLIIEGQHRRKDGTIFPVEANVSYIVLGENSYTIAVVRDITERKQVAQQIIHSLEEKETLLREIHHRVKNNMQVISSLLGLQSNYIKEKKYFEMFRDSRNRINSMSLIHEKLYRSKDLVNVEFDEYIRDLINSLFQSHGESATKIDLIIDIDKVSIGIDHAITCGLIINELITNSLKYAFHEDQKGEIRVSLRRIEEDEVELAVSDNGAGLKNDLDFRNTESLGLRLVTILAEKQLHGKIDLYRNRGTEFKIIFKERNNGRETNTCCGR